METPGQTLGKGMGAEPLPVFAAPLKTALKPAENPLNNPGPGHRGSPLNPPPPPLRGGCASVAPGAPGPQPRPPRCGGLRGPALCLWVEGAGRGLSPPSQGVQGVGVHPCPPISPAPGMRQRGQGQVNRDPAAPRCAAAGDTQSTTGEEPPTPWRDQTHLSSHHPHPRC